LPQFVIYVLANGRSYSRLGIQVRARIGTSVRRNYIKRIVREVFRKIEGDLRQGMDMIFIAEKMAVGMKYAELESGLRSALKRYLR
jgi:ribonuclease P protein component